MKISVVKHWDVWCIKVQQGCQRFHFNPYGFNPKATRTEVKWMADMFRKMVRYHDAEVIERYFKGNS